MQIPGPVIQQKAKIYRPYLKQLATLFETMDLEYKLTTEGYGFECKGCRANCCLTSFYQPYIVWKSYGKSRGFS